MLLKLYYISPAIIRNLGGINVTPQTQFC